MKVGMRIAFGLAIFLAVTGTVYGVTSYEWRGTVMLLVCAVGFFYVGLVLRGALRRASVPVTPETMAPEELAVEEPNVGPTIWPFVASIAAVLIIVGIVGVRWILILGLVLLGAVGAGWFLDIKRQWHPGELGAAQEEASPVPPSALDGEQQPHEDHRD